MTLFTSKKKWRIQVSGVAWREKKRVETLGFRRTRSSVGEEREKREGIGRTVKINNREYGQGRKSERINVLDIGRVSLEPTKEKERKRERMNGWISGK